MRDSGVFLTVSNSIFVIIGGNSRLALKTRLILSVLSSCKSNTSPKDIIDAMVDWLEVIDPTLPH